MTESAAKFGGDEAGNGSFASARFVVLPIPMESTVSYGGGTARGPAAILRASAELEFFDEELERPAFVDGEVHTLPMMTLPNDPERAVEAIAVATRRALEADKFVIALGGEHTISGGVIRAVRERRVAAGEEFGVLTVDAHLDLRASYHGARWSHGCVMRRVWEEHRPRMMWCGIRSVSAEEAAFVRESRLTPIYAHELNNRPHWIREAVDALPEKVFLSLDIDGLDPSAVPGTGTPEPGGLSYREVVALIREVAKRRTLIGADLVEVAPIAGQQVSEFTAARLVMKLIGALRGP
ncbi:MAG: agmatinase [Planctomycetota bacterium]